MIPDPVKINKYAVIDVGTNNILMLIAQKKGNSIIPLFRNSNISALGKNMKSGYLTKAGINRTKRILNDNIKYAKLYTEKIIMVGTSCSRDAGNIELLSKWLKAKYNLPYNIISGKDEAYYNGLANIEQFSDLNNFILFDVGGGSTEFIFVSAGKIKNSVSIQLGIRRLQNKFGLDMIAKIKEIRKLLTSMPIPGNFDLVGTGETATSISAIKQNLKNYEPSKIHRSIIDRSELENIIDRIENMNLAEIARLLPFDPLRSDIILTGAIIIKEIIDHFHGDSIHVSDQGLQFGILHLGENELRAFYRIN